MMAMVHNNPPKRVLERLLTGQLSDTQMPEVRDADVFVDSTLDVLGREEPTLSGWLDDDPQVRALLRASATASYALIMKDQRDGISLVETIKRLDALTQRAVATVALAAVMRERTLDI